MMEYSSQSHVSDIDAGREQVIEIVAVFGSWFRAEEWASLKCLLILMWYRFNSVSRFSERKILLGSPDFG